MKTLQEQLDVAVHLILDNSLIYCKINNRDYYCLHPMFAKDMRQLKERIVNTTIEILNAEKPPFIPNGGDS